MEDVEAAGVAVNKCKVVVNRWVPGGGRALGLCDYVQCRGAAAWWLHCLTGSPH